MINPLLRTLISEMVESYLEEETGLQTAKSLQKHFGKHSDGEIRSQKWKNHDYERPPNNEQHTFTVPVHHDEVKKHIVKSGWHEDKFSPGTYLHPIEGKKHTIKVSEGDRFGRNEKTVSHIKVFKTDHKGDMSTY